MKGKGKMTEATENKVVQSANIVEAYLKAWKNYFKITGRTSRYDYLGFSMINLLIGFVCAIIAFFLPSLAFIDTAYSWVILIPALTVMLRRLHDINRSGIFPISLLVISVILAIFPYGRYEFIKGIASITMLGCMFWLIWQTLRKGDVEANKYGEPILEDERHHKVAKRLAVFFLIFYLILPLAVLSIGFIAGYSNASLAIKANKTATQVWQTVSNARQLSTGKTTYDGIDVKFLMQENALPKGVTLTTEGKAINPFGGEFDVFGRDGTLGLGVSAVPDKACELLVQQDWGNRESTGFVSLTVVDQNAGKSCQNCGEKGCTLVWIFN